MFTTSLREGGFCAKSPLSRSPRKPLWGELFKRMCLRLLYTPLAYSRSLTSCALPENLFGVKTS